MSLLVGGELLLFGDVGDPWGWGDGFTPFGVAEALAEHGPGALTVRINSGGGVASDGVAIYSLLLAHRGVVTIIVDGVAASAASLIFMAGDERRMRPGSMLMIHDTARITWGNAAEHRKSAAFLDKLSDQYAAIYAASSGLDADTVRDLMRAETWFSADEAKEKGFITAFETAAALVAASFDYSLYTRAPDEMPRRAGPPAATGKAALPKEKPMSNTPAPKTPEPKTPESKTWVDTFFAAAEKTALPIARLNAIVAESATLEDAQTRLIAAQTDAPSPETAPSAAADKALADKTWAGGFFSLAEKSGLPVAKLNEIVSSSKDLAAAQACLIDAMAHVAGQNKPAPGAKTSMQDGNAPSAPAAFAAGREKVLAIKGKKAA